MWQTADNLETSFTGVIFGLASSGVVELVRQSTSSSSSTAQSVSSSSSTEVSETSSSSSSTWLSRSSSESSSSSSTEISVSSESTSSTEQSVSSSSTQRSISSSSTQQSVSSSSSTSTSSTEVSVSSSSSSTSTSSTAISVSSSSTKRSVSSSSTSSSTLHFHIAYEGRGFAWSSGYNVDFIYQFITSSTWGRLAWYYSNVSGYWLTYGFNTHAWYLSVMDPDNIDLSDDNHNWDLINTTGTPLGGEWRAATSILDPGQIVLWNESSSSSSTKVSLSSSSSTKVSVSSSSSTSTSSTAQSVSSSSSSTSTSSTAQSVSSSWSSNKVIRWPKGTASGNFGVSTLAGMSVNNGNSILVMGIGFGSISYISWGGAVFLEDVSAYGPFNSWHCSIWSAHGVTGGTDDLVVYFNTAGGCSIIATAVTGITGVDKVSFWGALAGTVTSNSTALTTKADEYLCGFVGSDAGSGNWTNSFTNGQSVVMSGLLGNEGYRLVETTGEYAATKDGFCTNVALIATYKVSDAVVSSSSSSSTSTSSTAISVSSSFSYSSHSTPSTNSSSTEVSVSSSTEVSVSSSTRVSVSSSTAVSISSSSSTNLGSSSTVCCRHDATYNNNDSQGAISCATCCATLLNLHVWETMFGWSAVAMQSCLGVTADPHSGTFSRCGQNYSYEISQKAWAVSNASWIGGNLYDIVRLPAISSSSSTAVSVSSSTKVSISSSSSSSTKVSVSSSSSTKVSVSSSSTSSTVASFSSSSTKISVSSSSTSSTVASFSSSSSTSTSSTAASVSSSSTQQSISSSSTQQSVSSSSSSTSTSSTAVSFSSSSTKQSVSSSSTSSTAVSVSSSTAVSVSSDESTSTAVSISTSTKVSVSSSTDPLLDCYSASGFDTDTQYNGIWRYSESGKLGWEAELVDVYTKDGSSYHLVHYPLPPTPRWVFTYSPSAEGAAYSCMSNDATGTWVYSGETSGTPGVVVNCDDTQESISSSSSSYQPLAIQLNYGSPNGVRARAYHSTDFCPTNTGTVEFWYKSSITNDLSWPVMSASFDGTSMGWVVGNSASGLSAVLYLTSQGDQSLYNAIDGAPPAANTWIHIRFGWTNTKGYWWENGVLKQTLTWTTDTLTDGAEDLYLEPPTSSGNHIFDEVRISNVLRVPSGWPTTTGFDPTAVGIGKAFTIDNNTMVYCHCDEGFGSVARDCSPDQIKHLNCIQGGSTVDFAWATGVSMS